MSGRAVVAFGVAVLVCGAAPGASQLPPDVYPEPVPRAAGVRAPLEVVTALRFGAPDLGIPAADAFLRSIGTAATHRTGERGLLVIPALFADSREPELTSDELQRLLFDGPSEGGTLPEFYEEASRGMLQVRGTVTPWVRTNVTILDAAGEREGHGWIGDRMRAYVADAIRRVDEELDFGQFDNDGPDGMPNSGDDDGWVDGFAVKYIEVSGACGGPAPWPHFGAARDSLNAPVSTKDLTPAGTPIRVQVYIADSAVNCTGTAPEGIQVLAHEFGHLIGLPDLYRAVDGTERQHRAWTVGCFDLMAAGAWGCGTGPAIPGFGPTHFSPLMKARLGWLQLIEVTHADHEEFVLEPAQTSGTALRVRLAPSSLESFLIEYRPAVGFDAALPASGVLVYHHDEFIGERPAPLTLPRPFSYHLVEADGDLALRRSEVNGGNRGTASDVFARDNTVPSLDDASSPSTRDHLGGSSTLTIHSIRIENGVARVVLSVGSGMQVAARELPQTPSALVPLNGRVALSGGTPPYTAQQIAGLLPEGLTAAVDGDALRVAGEPIQAGVFSSSFVIRDAEGRQISEAVRIDVRDVPIPPGQLVAALGPGGGLEPRIVQYLDRSANRNQRFDVGDLRAFLIRTRQVR